MKLLTEGRLTEVEYFTKWASLYRERVTVDIDDTHGSPMTLVKRAVELVDRRKRAIRRERTNAPFDEIWCVFDCDEHPYIQEAIATAERHQIGTAFSNPCFELWLVLHATDLRRHTERHAVQAMSAGLGFTVGKGLGPDAWPTLQANWEIAEERGVALDEMHHGNNSPIGSNPSTSIAQIVRSLQREQASGQTG